MLADGAFSHPNRIAGSKVMAILLNEWILPIVGALSGRVCSCSLRSRLVFGSVRTCESFCSPLNATCLFTRLDRVYPGFSRVSDSPLSAENVIYEDFVLMGELRQSISALP